MTYHGKSKEELIAEIELLREYRPAIDLSPITMPQAVEIAEKIQAIAFSMQQVLREKVPGDTVGLSSSQKAVVRLIEDNAEMLSAVSKQIHSPLVFVAPAEDQPQ